MALGLLCGYQSPLKKHHHQRSVEPITCTTHPARLQCYLTINLIRLAHMCHFFLTPKHENCSGLCLLPAVLGNAGSKQEITVIVLTLSRSEPLPPFLLKSRTTSNIFAQKSNFTSNIWFNCYRSNANRQSARGKDLEPNKNTQIVYELIFLLLHIIIILLTISMAIISKELVSSLFLEQIRRVGTWVCGFLCLPTNQQQYSTIIIIGR